MLRWVHPRRSGRKGPSLQGRWASNLSVCFRPRNKPNSVGLGSFSVQLWSHKCSVYVPCGVFSMLKDEVYGLVPPVGEHTRESITLIRLHKPLSLLGNYPVPHTPHLMICWLLRSPSLTLGITPPHTLPPPAAGPPHHDPSGEPTSHEPLGPPCQLLHLSAAHQSLSLRPRQTRSGRGSIVPICKAESFTLSMSSSCV